MPLSKTAIPFFLILFIPLTSIAQDNKDPDTKKSYFKFSASYLSNAVYYGRKDSLALPYIMPSISYNDKSGFYIEASLSYLASAGESQVDAGAITAGYEFESKNENSPAPFMQQSFLPTAAAIPFMEKLKAQ